MPQIILCVSHTIKMCATHTWTVKCKSWNKLFCSWINLYCNRGAEQSIDDCRLSVICLAQYNAVRLNLDTLLTAQTPHPVYWRKATWLNLSKFHLAAKIKPSICYLFVLLSWSFSLSPLFPFLSQHEQALSPLLLELDELLLELSDARPVDLDRSTWSAISTRSGRCSCINKRVEMKNYWNRFGITKHQNI